MVVETAQYCSDENRKALVRAEGSLNGIDYLEVLGPACSVPVRVSCWH